MQRPTFNGNEYPTYRDNKVRQYKVGRWIHWRISLPALAVATTLFMVAVWLPERAGAKLAATAAIIMGVGILSGIIGGGLRDSGSPYP